jgi:hypothetical protein
MRFLEWADHDGDGNKKWAYIDDDSQNLPYAQLANVWAPNEDEVYVSMMEASILAGGTMGAYIFYGARADALGGIWAWSRYHFVCGSLEPTRVWGTSAADVFVLACKKIYRRDDSVGADSGIPGWRVDYEDEDPNPAWVVHAIVGTSLDGIWIVGERQPLSAGTCTVIVRRTGDGYQRIVDGTPTARECTPKEGFLTLPGTLSLGVHSTAKESLVGVRTFRVNNQFANDVVRVLAQSDDQYSLAFSNYTPAITGELRSVWGTSDHDLWFLRHKGNGGSIVHGTNLWGSEGAYEFSTLALNGAPNFAWLSRLHGTSNDNLWAVGDQRAFHKSTR